MCKRFTPYQRIVKAAESNRGIRLSAAECWEMHLDDAIARRADCDSSADCLWEAFIDRIFARPVEGD